VAGFENLLHVGQHLLAQCAELGATVVDGGRTDGPQDAIGHGRGAWNLQEVATRGVEIRGEHARRSLSVFHSFFVFKLLLSRVFVLKSVDTTHFFVFKKLLWALTNRPFLGPFCMRKWRSACAKCWWRA
jgi:hypothetical protein